MGSHTLQAVNYSVILWQIQGTMFSDFLDMQQHLLAKLKVQQKKRPQERRRQYLAEKLWINSLVNPKAAREVAAREKRKEMKKGSTNFKVHVP